MPRPLVSNTRVPFWHHVILRSVSLPRHLNTLHVQKSGKRLVCSNHDNTTHILIPLECRTGERTPSRPTPAFRVDVPSVVVKVAVIGSSHLWPRWESLTWSSWQFWLARRRFHPGFGWLCPQSAGREEEQPVWVFTGFSLISPDRYFSRTGTAGAGSGWVKTGKCTVYIHFSHSQIASFYSTALYCTTAPDRESGTERTRETSVHFLSQRLILQRDRYLCVIKGGVYVQIN